MFDTLKSDPTAVQMSSYTDIRKAVKPAISPDGELLAFLSDASGTAQVWIKPLAGGEAK